MNELMNLWVTLWSTIKISNCRSWSSPKGMASQNSWEKLTAPQAGRSHCPSLCWCIPHQAPFHTCKISGTETESNVCKQLFSFCCTWVFCHFCKFNQLTVHSNTKGSSKSTWPDMSSSQLWFSQLTPKAPQQPKNLLGKHFGVEGITFLIVWTVFTTEKGLPRHSKWMY